MKGQIYIVTHRSKCQSLLKVGDLYMFKKYNDYGFKNRKTMIVRLLNGEKHKTFGVFCDSLCYMHEENNIKLAPISPAIKIMFGINDES